MPLKTKRLSIKKNNTFKRSKHTKKNKIITQIENEKEEKTIFVFYTFLKGGSWQYTTLPNGWWWVGSGKTNSLNGKKLRYENEEQFMGPEDTQKQMVQYLNKFFEKLKKQKIIKVYKIKSVFLP